MNPIATLGKRLIFAIDIESIDIKILNQGLHEVVLEPDRRARKSSTDGEMQ